MTNEEISSILEKAWPGWRLVRFIGGGDYGNVYEIQKPDPVAARSAALKVIPVPAGKLTASGELRTREYYERATESMMKKYHVMAALREHPNIVACEDCAYIPKADGVGLYVLIRTELLTTLNEYVSVNGLSRQSLIKLGIDICSALEQCQRYKMIHRAVKPGNIFVSASGDFKLGDFGVAKNIEAALGVQPDQSAYIYSAPEVFAGRRYDMSVDTYSLGLIMYRCLNRNRLPFAAGKLTREALGETLRRRTDGEELPAPEGESGPLADIVLKACRFDPAERFADPAGMRRELEALVDAGDKVRYLAPRKPTPVPIVQAPPPGADGATRPEREVVQEKPAQEKFVPVVIPHDNSSLQATSGAGDAGDAAAFNGKKADAAVEAAPKKNKKRAIIAAAAAFAVLVGCVAVWFLFLRKPDGSSARDGQQPPTTQSQPTDAVKDADKPVEASAAPVTKPLGSDWSEWSDELPAEAAAGGYVVEAALRYRSAPCLRSESETGAPEGYTLRYADYGEFGEWSEWRETEVEDKDSGLLQFEERTVYLYRTLYSYEYSDNLQITTKTSYYWSDWVFSEAPVAAGASVEVQTVRQYRFRERQATYCFSRDEDWSEFGQEPIAPADELVVETKTVYRWKPETGTAATASMTNFMPQPPAGGSFGDVDDSEWYGADISGCIAAAAGLGAVTPDRYLRFRPTESVTLAEVVKAAVIINRIYNGATGVLPEGDVWYQCYVDYAVEKAMLAPGAFTDFTADATRAEAVYILNAALPAAELLGVNIVTGITDLDISSPYYKSVYRLAQAGVIAWPEPEYSFNAEGKMTRAEVAAIVERLAYPENRVKND